MTIIQMIPFLTSSYLFSRMELTSPPSFNVPITQSLLGRRRVSQNRSPWYSSLTSTPPSSFVIRAEDDAGNTVGYILPTPHVPPNDIFLSPSKADGECYFLLRDSHNNFAYYDLYANVDDLNSVNGGPASLCATSGFTGSPTSMTQEPYYRMYPLTFLRPELFDTVRIANNVPDTECGIWSMDDSSHEVTAVWQSTVGGNEQPITWFVVGLSGISS